MIKQPGKRKDDDTVALSSSWSVISNAEGRVQLFRNELAQNNISVSNLRRMCLNGIPGDATEFRCLTWKLIMGLLPSRRSVWEETLDAKRKEYASFCEDLIIDPKAENNGDARIDSSKSASSSAISNGEGGAVDVTDHDHPLALTTDSKWNAFFKDQDMKDQIERDVMRTHPDMHFFSGDGEEAATHRKEMMRALFIFAKLNPGLMYVQGMNELYAPLYYVFKKSPEKNQGQFAEADAFYCFIDLLAEFRDHFCKQLDNSDVGIRATITRFSQMLRRYDPQLWHHLEVETKVEPQYYCFRWITLLLTQEFSFPDVLRLWDTLLAAPNGRLNFLLKFCIAMLMHVRDDLLAGDFSQNIKLLQQFPPLDVNIIIQKALSMDSMHSPDYQIYTPQHGS